MGFSALNRVFCSFGNSGCCRNYRLRSWEIKRKSAGENAERPPRPARPPRRQGALSRGPAPQPPPRPLLAPPRRHGGRRVLRLRRHRLRARHRAGAAHGGEGAAAGHRAGGGGVFLAGVAAAGVAGVVRVRAAQRPRGCPPAARAARLRRRRLRPAAGALPLRLLQAAQESGRRAGDHQRGRAVPHLPQADGVRLGFVLRHHQRHLFSHQHPGRLHWAGHRRDPRRLPVLFHHVGVPHHGPGPAPHLLGGDFLRRLRETSLRLPGAGGRQSPPHLGADVPEPPLRGQPGPHLHHHPLHRPLGLRHRRGVLPQPPQVPLLQAGGQQQSDDVLGAAGALRGLSGRRTQVPR